MSDQTWNEHRVHVLTKLEEHDDHHERHYATTGKHTEQIAVISTRLMVLWVACGFVFGAVATWLVARVLQAAP